MRAALGWIVGGGLMMLAAFVVAFNLNRHRLMAAHRRAGSPRNVSGIPFLGSVFFLAGWRLSPLEPTAWVFLVLLTEAFALVTVSPPDDDAAG
ncbi:MAG: hypothetical protein AAF389_05605 [Gemmatimonadota bacterium]